MEERLLFKLLQWAGIGVGGDNKEEESIQEEMMTKTMHRSNNNEFNMTKQKLHYSETSK